MQSLNTSVSSNLKKSTPESLGCRKKGVQPPIRLSLSRMAPSDGTGRIESKGLFRHANESKTRFVERGKRDTETHDMWPSMTQYLLPLGTSTSSRPRNAVAEPVSCRQRKSTSRVFLKTNTHNHHRSRGLATSCPYFRNRCSSAKSCDRLEQDRVIY